MGSAGLCLNSDIWGSIRLQWHPGGPMCLGWRLFVQSRSCIANSSRRTLQPHVAAGSAGLLHLQHREEPEQTSRAALWMKTSPSQRFNMQATDRHTGCFPHTQSAYSWQWIYKVSDFHVSLLLPVKPPYGFLKWDELPWGLGCWTCGWRRGCWYAWWLPSFCPMSAGRSSLPAQRSAKTLSWLQHWCS